jgi:rare lipoprotein A
MSLRNVAAWSVKLGMLAIAWTLVQGCSAVSLNRIESSGAEGDKIVTSSSPTVGLPAPANSAPKISPVNMGHASWYGPGFVGKKTASGDIFDDTKLTAAHKTLPLGSKAKVTNLNNGRSVRVEINDRGPFVGNRIIDLSKAAAHALGMVEDGVVQVRVDPLDQNQGELSTQE